MTPTDTVALAVTTLHTKVSDAMAKLAAALALVLACAGVASAYPSFWASEYAPSCTAVPTAGKACHKAPMMDARTVVSLVPAAGGAPVKTACAGKAYTVKISFPEARLAYLTLSGGAVTVKNALNSAKCPNTFTFAAPTGFSPSRTFSTSAVAPASGSWVVSVASATGGCAPFMITRATVPVARC
ncbi:hypothetical protein HT031_005001 [Scenedesmus sp. PABB004]|nr:hypothetical protein HT031_005001 [Scenedesmus sp. PABB004]